MRIFLAGHTGMVGSAILRRLISDGGNDIIIANRTQLDLRDQTAVKAFIKKRRPDLIILAAAKVGGILANHQMPAAFIHDNLMIAGNIIHAAHDADVQRIIQLGSSCIYPRDTPQPIPENALLTGPLEPTNEPYAIAKIAAIKLCESYNRQYGRDCRSLMPTNLYGPGDNFHPQFAHVLPSLLDRFHRAVQEGNESVTLWGSGTPRREFLHVDDLADAIMFLSALPTTQYEAATSPMCSHLNVGTGKDISILDLAAMIAQITGFQGQVLTDLSKPDGTPRKQLDTSAMTALGWSAQTDLRDGITETYGWYETQRAAGHRLRAS
ncbi:GDP-L-fucose synthase family protein [Loktanella sp. Alg231-35]|uniref:GDP-L-fucose synthase family protein n=1 Tax=Loktanella sp. Alg231-35 TaxID=1922220 RepID=UPI000D54DBEF|nr:GDP-L-fucose synthase [Loktanella sp. Alg231-35]